MIDFPVGLTGTSDLGPLKHISWCVSEKTSFKMKDINDFKPLVEFFEGHLEDSYAKWSIGEELHLGTLVSKMSKLVRCPRTHWSYVKPYKRAI